MKNIFKIFLTLCVAALLLTSAGCGGMTGEKGQHEGKDVPKPKKNG